MLMPLISLRATKFSDCCFPKHSMITLPDVNFVTFFTSPAQPDCFFYGDIFVIGFLIWCKNFDFFYYILPFLRWWNLVLRQKRGLHGAIYNSSPSLSPPTTVNSGELMCSGRVSSSCSTRDTRRANLVPNDSFPSYVLMENKPHYIYNNFREWHEICVDCSRSQCCKL